ncbi:YsnF/AvaK domain-containing protein [Acidisoma cladoniae]|uniref:YsnF/AvaK domain-containing protein n=1 Tax=Acidisoma cladoniae TaxID=3040935 RepID=UPI00254B9957|nr:YsnF/AvaK domain-containing protein [Acidisoma sp. PAMC 29798]
MASETIVAIYDNAADASAAVSDLHDAGIPASAIEQHSKDTGYLNDTRDIAVESEPHKTGGFWAWLTGEGTDDTHHALYDRSIESGSTVVTVVTDEMKIDTITAILESHSPVDLTERHDHYGTDNAVVSDAAYTHPVETAPLGHDTMAAHPGGNEEVLALSEEQLEIGKRQIDRGTTRIRRYVVERPVEEQITLRNETVNVYRRPATGASTVGAFTDKTIEVTETAEEAVIAKTAHVVEEVVVGKTVEDRVETVHETLRRDEVEITKAGDVVTPTNRVP